jgi:hypothetical protein
MVHEPDSPKKTAGFAPPGASAAPSPTRSRATSPRAAARPDDAPLPFLDLPGAPSPAPTESVDTVAAHEAKGRRRPEDTIWRRNPRDQGLIGVTDAMAWFGARGWDVCVPLIDNQPYDLVVDDGAGLKKVQVKTTTYRSPRGRFVVQLSTHGGNQSYHTKRYLDAALFDLLFVLTDGGDRYLVPSEAITAKTALTLGAGMEPYRVS